MRGVLPFSRSNGRLLGLEKGETRSLRAIWMYESLFRNRNRRRGCEGLESSWDEVGCGIDAWTGKGKKVRRAEQLILPAQAVQSREDEVIPAKEEGSNVVQYL